MAERRERSAVFSVGGGGGRKTCFLRFGGNETDYMRVAIGQGFVGGDVGLLASFVGFLAPNELNESEMAPVKVLDPFAGGW